MKAPLSWLREYAALPDDLTGRELAEALIRAGLEVETVEAAGADVTGPLLVGRVLAYDVEEHSNGKSIRWCQVDVGEAQPRGIVCGAHNFEVGDLVVVALPGAALPGPFAISARKTYGHVSDGMICSAKELGLGDDHTGIIVLGGADLEPGSDAIEGLHLRDDVLDIAVTPDRGYCLSIRGLARESAEALGVPFRDPVAYQLPMTASDGYPVRLESPFCPVFAAVIVTGIDADRPSPRWMQRRLQLTGMRPISLAVDITNYVMLETGQPIHGYDGDRLRGPIVVRQATPGTTLTTLDDVARPLSGDDLVIADDSGPIGLAGVMGGESTELSATTTTAVIEAAHFDAMTIARAGRRHKLSSEASRRFERGVDPAATYAGARRTAELLVELAGGELGAETVAGALPAVESTTIDADLSGRVLGAEIAADQVVGHLEAVGVEVVADGSSLVLSPPSWRPDLRDPYDFVEEVGRLYGYEQIPPVVPQAPVGRGLTRDQRNRRAVTAAAAAAGFVEVLSLPFVAETDIERLGVQEIDQRRNLVRIANPLADTSPFLRSTLLPGLFAAVARNTSRGNDDLALFETGSVFFAAQPAVPAPRPAVDRRPEEAELAAMDAALPRQPKHLAAVLTGDWTEAGWRGPGVRAGWEQAIALVDTVAAAIGLSITREADEQSPWHPGRCARFVLADRVTGVGFAGELHPEVCRAFGLPARTAAVEIDLDALLAAAPRTGDVVPISPYPVAKEDVALIVGEDVPAANVAQALSDGAGELLESVRLFDVYRGPQIGEGRKSLAYALRFRAPDRTLTEADAGAARDAAVAAATAAAGAIQRVE